MEQLAKMFWGRVDKAICSQGKTLENLSDETAVAYNTITSQRNKGIIPKAPQIIAMSRSLGVSIDWLLKGEVADTLSDEEKAVRNDADIRYLVKIMMSDKSTLSLIASLLHKTEFMTSNVG